VGWVMKHVFSHEELKDQHRLKQLKYETRRAESIMDGSIKKPRYDGLGPTLAFTLELIRRTFGVKNVSKK
jgi:hypothetical protein